MREQAGHIEEQGVGDPLLLLFSDRANRKGLEIEITLQVGGLLISGFLTSLAGYRQRLEAQMSEGLATIDPEFKPEELPKGDLATDLSSAPADEFIHLRDACISRLGYGEQVIRTPVWRGRLSSVDGFSLGLPDHLRSGGASEYGH